MEITGGTPFEEDCAVQGFLERFDLVLERRVGMEITDLKALEENGLMRKSPDYSKIRRLLNDGAIVRGANLGGVEYVLRRRRES